MMRAISLLWPLLAAACGAGPDTPPPVAGSPVGGAIAPGCDQARLDPAWFLGKRPVDTPIARFAFPVRIIAPGTAVTMDFSPQRLNLETDGAGAITRFYCG